VRCPRPTPHQLLPVYGFSTHVLPTSSQTLPPFSQSSLPLGAVASCTSWRTSSPTLSTDEPSPELT
jgi:hypothetical protein